MKHKAIIMLTEEILGGGPQIQCVKGAYQPAQLIAQGCCAKLKS